MRSVAVGPLPVAAVPEEEEEGGDERAGLPGTLVFLSWVLFELWQIWPTHDEPAKHSWERPYRSCGGPAPSLGVFGVYGEGVGAVSDEIGCQAKIPSFVHAAPAGYRTQLNLHPVKLQNEVRSVGHSHNLDLH